MKKIRNIEKILANYKPAKIYIQDVDKTKN